MEDQQSPDRSCKDAHYSAGPEGTHYSSYCKKIMEQEGSKQEVVEAIIKEAIQAARATEKKTNQAELVGQILHFSREPTKEMIIFNECMTTLEETLADEHWDELASSLRNSHSDLVHALPKLAYMIESYYNHWKASQELEESVKVEFCESSFDPTHCDSWVTCELVSGSEEVGEICCYCYQQHCHYNSTV